MALGTTTNLSLKVYDDGDNPGAGSKTVSAGNTGLNANPLILDAAVGAEHNADGTHRDDKINGNSLKASVVDGSTLDVSAATGAKTLKVKDGGIGTTQLAAGGVTTAKIATDAVDSTILKDDAVTDANRAVTTNHIRDAAVTTAKIADGAVTAAKLSSEIGWQWIFGDLRVAGTSAGNTPAALSEWTETSATNVKKLAFILPRITGTRIVRVRANIKTSNAAKAWTLALTDDVGTEITTATGINTTYDATTVEANLSYTLTQDDSLQHAGVELQVHIRVASSATTTMKNLQVYITPS